MSSSLSPNDELSTGQSSELSNQFGSVQRTQSFFGNILVDPRLHITIYTTYSWRIHDHLNVLLEVLPDFDYFFSSVLTWCFYYLAAHPEVQENVYREMMAVVGETGRITTQNVKNFK